MADPIVDIDDLALYLNDTLDESRAQYVLDLSIQLCETVINPLPDAAASVVLDVAQRGYSNPTSVRNASLGLYAEGQGPYSDGTPGVTSGGIWLTAGNVAALRRLAGGGSAFSIDLTPAGAGENLPIWDTGNVWYSP